jgi:hypothetical protein
MSPRDWTLFIPDNDYGIEKGYYSMNELVQMLRANCDKPDVVHFLADMMEE